MIAKRHLKRSFPILGIIVLAAAGVGAFYVTSSRAASPTVANLYIDSDGGTCTRQSTAGAYNNAQACTWNAAYAAAQSNDTILVKGGSYGTVRVRPNRSSITGVKFAPVQNESVSFDWFNGGDYQDPGISNVTYLGPMTAKRFSADGTSNVTVDGWTVDGQGADNVQIFHAETTTNFTAKNNEVMNNKNNSLSYVNGTNLVFENNTFHDAGLPSGSGAHTECMYATSTNGITLRGNHFYRCSVMDVFITGNTGTTSGTVENNVFETPWGNLPGSLNTGALAFHFRNSPSDNITPDVGNWTFRNNTFAGNLSFGDQSGSFPNQVVGPVVIKNNVFLRSAPCGVSNTTWSYNAHKSGSCGGTGSFTNASLSTNSFNNSTENPGPGDWSLKTGSPLIDAADAGSYPSVDLTGASRYAGAGPDIGAYEFGATSGGGSTVGDLNSDGSVNIFDLSILLSNFNQQTATGDLNSDGTVNIFDLSILLSNFG